ncbi:tyramine oxidase, partial [bacterium]|nr:tyramine oxidase [bacterium]
MQNIKTLFILISILVFIPGILFCSASHPLDALTASEITKAVAVLRDARLADNETLFSSIKLQEPEKSVVLSWKEGDAIARAAEVIFRKNAKTYEAVVDLVSGKVASHKEIPGAQPFETMPEIMSAIETTLADPKMQEGLRKRGITDFKQVFCAPRTIGNFGSEMEQTRRLTKVDCFDIRGVKSDVFANPIEGLFATVGIDHRQVLKVTDLGVVPIPRGNTELDPASTGVQKGLKPVMQSSPQGSNINMKGSFVQWQKWSFHVRWDIRAGVVISLVDYTEKDEPRSILYQGYLSEIFVPYQDPTESWYFRTYMDEGDFGFGTMGSLLVPGADCPASSIFLSPVM